MLLAIDVGNTNTVFAVYDHNQQIFHARLRSADQHSGDEYASFLRPLLDHVGLGFSTINHVYIASVVPKARRGLREFSQKYINREAHFIVAEDTGIEIDLPAAGSVGVDRLLNALTFLQEGGDGPAIVVDFGTATTFDVIDDLGRYSGGAIAPGINLSMEALAAAAAKLPMVEITPTEAVIAKTTEDAMKSGLFWGYAGLIEGMLLRMSDELGTRPVILATGGLAPLFADHIELIEKVDQDLTLRGIVHIYNKKEK